MTTTPKKKPSKKVEKLTPFASLGLGDGSRISPKEDIMEKISNTMEHLGDNMMASARADGDSFRMIKREDGDMIMRLFDTTSGGLIHVSSINSGSENQQARIQSLWGVLRLLEKCGVITISKDVFKDN